MLQINPKYQKVVVVFFLTLVLLGSYYIHQVPSGENIQIETIQVFGDSMSTIIPSGSVIFHEPNYYQTHPINRNDIVLFHTRFEKKLVLKRVIAIPGDKLELRDWSLYVNGTLAKNSQNIEYEFRSPAFAALTSLSPIVPENSVLLMGEPRKGSLDSSMLGFVPTDSIVSRVVRY